MEATGKDWKLSKTVWFNAIAGTLMVLEGQFHMLQTMLPQQWYVGAFMAVTFINLVLRGMTTQPIRLPGKKRSGNHVR